jgi:phosphoglycolate phosphatase-like HAD superfamily hydrolase
MTLISTRGAGMASLDAALKELYDLENGFVGVEFAGRTDRMIIEDGLARNGLDSGDGSILSVRSVYIRCLSRVLSGGWPAKVLDGVSDLLDLLSGRTDVIFGLLTGNWKEGAFLKLAACGVDGYFRFGAFAESGRRRSDLVPHALDTAGRMRGSAFDRDDVWVIGDTPHDVACGRDWGLKTLAVATGPYGVKDLEASGASLVLPDLSDTQLLERTLFE